MPQQRQTAVSLEEETTGEETRQKAKRRKTEKAKKSRSIPWYLKFLMTIVLLFGSLTGGLAVGYTMVGKGKMSDVFDIETYKHIYDLVFKTV
ncbi:DNA-directed RNA polymerase subunit beta [Ammoniphilus sp. CFH 90114]|uniref:DNA-directed RNA polymerase subunit beta n=1 Tax=Ammoniphilus sp. CFH 90114 TaxID=2493665 RepID=UPI00100F62E2|nr:DNA-directed RNA polymerase subunit beta [Ammoniphilus sp. CFH 90114]RXT04358.1 DNA-directed RNA polymerase subunit beta [Ammoniphilus sp. CFH 90114]